MMNPVRSEDHGPAAALVAAHGWVGVSTPVIMTAKFLSQKGYLVDIFLEESPSCERLGINIPKFNDNNIRLLIHNRGKVADGRASLFHGLTIPAGDMEFASRFKQPPGQYDFVVGFDPDGLVRAGLLSSCWEVPLIYHSLELYDETAEAKERERWFSQRALLTLIQDEARARIISRMNGIDRDKICIVFNNSIGETLTEKKGFFRTKFNIPEDKAIVLATGTLLPITCIDKILRSTAAWPSRFVLVLHGWIPDRSFESFVKSFVEAGNGGIYLSTDVVSQEDKFTLFQSSDIGLAFYEPSDINLEFAAGSSGKTFDFMRCGVPIIGNDIPGMDELIQGNECGLVVRDDRDIGRCLTDIQKNYQYYRDNCFKAFHRYSFSDGYEEVLGRINAWHASKKMAGVLQPESDEEAAQDTKAPAHGAHRPRAGRNQHEPPEDRLDSSDERWPEGEVFIASFPRSGNTWLRLLLSDTIMQMHGIRTDTELVLNLSDRIIPDIHCHDTRDIDSRIQLPFRLIKTHKPYSPDIRKAVFLFRSPADALCSYYHFKRGHDKLSSEFLDNKNAFALSHTGEWNNHAKSFIQSFVMGRPILFVSYESLHEEPLATLQRVLAFLGLRADDSVCRIAIGNHAFVHHKDRWVFGTDHQEHFFRKGKIGSAGEELEPKVLERIVGDTASIHDATRDIAEYQADATDATSGMAAAPHASRPLAGYVKHVEREMESCKRGGDSSLDRLRAPGVGDPADASGILIRRAMLLATLACDVKDFELSLRLTSMAKSLKRPVEGLDYLRALAFHGLGQKGSAQEALKEELRYFPGNRAARGLMDKVGFQAGGTTTEVGHSEFDEILRIIRPYTMVGEKRLRSLYTLVRKACELDFPGNIVECGVAAGGSSALIAAVVKRHSLRPRRVFCFDTFEGMPDPTELDTHLDTKANDTGWGSGTCAAPMESLLEVCSKLDVLDMVTPVKGLFKDTLPEARAQIGPIAFLHMDGDWYESTRDILVNLFDQVISGGFIQVDDYGHWQGCRKALHEFFEHKDLRPVLTDIDGTGAWFAKEEAQPDQWRQRATGRMINLGCGKHVHPDWVNVDFHSTGPTVTAHDLGQGIPFGDASFDTVYHSHLLEHFPKSYAPRFLGECFRVLKPGGAIRVVVPDLEQIARLYLEMIEGSAAGDVKAQERYEWITVELLDQMARNAPGGEMRKYWMMDPMPAEDFVVQRVGSEVLNALAHIRKSPSVGSAPDGLENGADAPRRIGAFRLSGEVHQWMYDRYSLEKMLHDAGFQEIKICRADESRIPRFNSYLLDIEPNGSVRKPDSLFMEASKPLPAARRNATNAHDHENGMPARQRKTATRILKNSLKVVHLCTFDHGGAGKAAWRLHKGLQSTGVDSTMVVLSKNSGDPSVKVLPEDYSNPPVSCLDVPWYASPVYERLRRGWNESLLRYPERPSGLEVFTGTESLARLDLLREVIDADVVHLHWVAGMLDYSRLPRMLAAKHIVWTLHDMNPFTGGCHYPGDCTKYTTACHECPQLGSDSQHDLSSRIWAPKFDAYDRMSIHVVTPSKWLEGCASQSRLFRRFPRSVIANGLPLDIYRPCSKSTARKLLGIAGDSRVILFGAASVLNGRKGLVYLVDALNRMKQDDRHDLTLMMFGAVPQHESPSTSWPVKSFGHVADEAHLALIYSAADAFVIPSLEDNLPNTVAEALACGVPVVGFAAGGIPEMVAHKETGYMVEPRDVPDLVEGIRWALSSTADFGKHCRQKALDEYALDTQAKRYGELYRSISAEHPPQSTDRALHGREISEAGKSRESSRPAPGIITSSPTHEASQPGEKALAGDQTAEKLRPCPANAGGGKAPLPKSNIKVTAIVSAFNSEEFIAGCLNNLLEQTIADQLEIVVVNSGSQEKEHLVIQEFETRFPNIKYIRCGQRETIYSSWSRGAAAARGKYLVNTNTDDRLRRDALERMSDVLDRHDDVGVVYIDQIITEHPNETFDNHHTNGFLRRSDFSRSLIVQKNPCGPQVMWRKRLHDTVGFFNPRYEVAGDWEFWLRVVFRTNYTIHHIPELLGLYYYNKKGLEHGQRKQTERLREIEELKRKYSGTAQASPPLVADTPTSQKVRRNEVSSRAQWPGPQSRPEASGTGRRILLTTSAAPTQSPFSTTEKRPPIGIGYLIAVLRNAGHQVYFIDNYLHPSDFLETDYLRKNHIEFVGIYANTICYRDTLRMFHKLNYLRLTGQWNGKIIVGGPHTTVCPETIPDFVDHIVQGEGELAILDIVEGRVPDRLVKYPRITDLDALPMPAWDYFVKLPYNWGGEFFQEGPVFTMNTSRGCPFNCRFCSVNSIWGKRYTCLSAERIVDEIEHLMEQHGARGIYFREDNFTLNTRRLKEFCGLLDKRGIRIPWACETRVSSLDREVVEMMANSGACGFYLGVESGCQRLLDFLKKDITVDQIRNAFRICHEFDIKTAASVIVGVPTETEADLRETISLLKEIKPTVTWFNVFVGIPTSDLYRYTIENKLYDYIDDRGLIYLKGHNERTKLFYGGKWNAEIPVSATEIPRVSVVMSVHNGARFLRKAVDSILRQTCQQLEFIIVDDGSTDDTAQILRGMEDPRIRIMTNHGNLGLAKSLNIAIGAARAKFIARMDADDVALPHRLETQLAVLDGHPEIALLGSSYYQIDENEKVTDLITVLTKDPDIRVGLEKQNWFGHGTVVMRRDAVLSVGGYDEKFKYSQDYDLWMRLSERYKVANIEEPLYCWRVTSSCISRKNEAEQKHYAEMAVLAAEERRRESSIPKGMKLSSESPKVSVIVPTFNRPESLAGTLESIRAQTLQEHEIIVVNDAGINVRDVIDKFNIRDNIVYLRHDENKGLAAARNTGIRAAKGKYIAYLDDDDLYYPNHLETLVDFLELTHYKVAYTDACRAHQEQTDSGYRVTGRDVPYSFDFDYDRILVENFVPVLCFMHEKMCLNEVGFFDESLRTHEDWDLWIRMSRKYRLAHIKKITCEFTWRQDGTTMSSRFHDLWKRYEVIYKKHSEHTMHKPELLRLMALTIDNFKNR